jgi:hypothetical protein
MGLARSRGIALRVLENQKNGCIFLKIPYIFHISGFAGLGAIAISLRFLRTHNTHL